MYILSYVQCIAAIQQVHQDISDVEARFGVMNPEEVGNKERLNFGLVEVVYEWARNKVNIIANL